ncbi:hypothetical protein COOONC_21971 [Cooperia oncophora]
MIPSVLLLSSVTSVASLFWNGCCTSGGFYGSYGSYGYTNHLSYTPAYSSYSSYLPYGGIIIWYPDALEYVNRRLREYYSTGSGYVYKGRGSRDKYPERNHLYVRPYTPKQRPYGGYAQKYVAAPPPPPIESIAPPAPPSEEEFDYEAPAPAPSKYAQKSRPVEPLEPKFNSHAAAETLSEGKQPGIPSLNHFSWRQCYKTEIYYTHIRSSPKVE